MIILIGIIFSHYRVRLHVSYDNEFLENVASRSHSTAVNRINSILNIAKEIFKWKSLSTEIELDIIDVKHVDRTLKLHGSTIGRVLYVILQSPISNHYSPFLLT